MDEQNKRALMTFYDDLGLQVFIAAPMMNKADLVGYMETMIEIDRVEDEQAQASVAYHKQRAREEVVAMNPQRMSSEEIAAGIVDAADAAEDRSAGWRDRVCRFVEYRVV